ncbi:hypothetical protein RDI58_029930 [Solanum bulbocastanum]|uniref:Kinesin motor domain-containing protein n=1 Tax=Solanum bulbocastanum TaxID=147425 RepID=A0AAN8SXQ8_SOLBU
MSIDVLGFSLTSPDLVICTGSPDIPARSYGDSPEFLKGCSISLENGIKGSEEVQAATKLLTDWQGSNDEYLCLSAHFELPSPPGVEENSSELPVPIVSINVGSRDCISSESGIQFSEDKYFCGGNVLTTDTRIEESICASVYQTARVGNFSPLNAEETAAGASMTIDFEAAKDGELTVKSNTGTGKTFTMEGTEESRGVNYRTLEELFRIIEERKNAVRYEISVSVLEFQQQHIRQQNEEEDAAPTRLPLSSKISALKTCDENKFPLNITRPLTENNSYKLSVPSATVDCPLKHNDLTEKENKENNPDIDEQPVVLKRLGRASMCPIAHRILPTPAPRRNSLIPIRTLSAVPKLPPPLFPLRSIQSEEMEDADGVDSKCLPEPTPQDSPKELKTASKKLNSVLRRSLQKKMQFKSPMQQNIRRVGVNVGMEKVRISIVGFLPMKHLENLMLN